MKTKFYPGCPIQYSCIIQEFSWDLAQVLKKHEYTKLEESILRIVSPYLTSSREGENREFYSVASNPKIPVESVKEENLQSGSMVLPSVQLCGVPRVHMGWTLMENRTSRNVLLPERI